MKNIIKICYVEEDIITLELEDPRDEYIYKNALGKIGTINFSKEGVLISPNYEVELRTTNIWYKELEKAFYEIFGSNDFDMLSGQYYKKIKQMITNGKLQSLGYTIKSVEELSNEETFLFPRR